MTTLASWRSGASGPPVARRRLDPGRLAAAAARLRVPPEQLLLAAHLKVVAALTGEREVCTRYRGRCHRVEVGAGPWQDLVHATVNAAGREPADCDSAFGATPDARAGLQVSYHPAASTLEVRLDPERFSADYADRVAGYHDTALRHLATDPAADHATADLLSAAERRLQLHGHAGEPRELPGRRLPELVAAQAARAPHRPAVRCGDRSWSYAELDAAANRVAQALLAAGLGPEDVVAVVMPRALEWAAALLGVLRAGGAYLPVDPAYPPERIVTMLARSGCRFVLADGESPGLAQALADERLAGVRRVHPVATTSGALPAVTIGADQLAYIYFTSGSTGHPKGAMCTHAGMVNHLLAKVADLGLRPEDVVAQNAPQCFDISLWQLVAPLLVGAESLIVPPAEVREVSRFRQVIRAGRVTVLQLVPSYLDILVTDVERRGGDLGRVRCVSVTGEAVSRALVARWFARFPQTTLVNAYGATEASDDTTHAILTAVPEGELVPVGRPVPNVAVYVLDERLRLVPLGAPGEIAFSGLCVGRGYVNDPDRTHEAFGADPLRPGQRLYRTGDIGRWLPGGVLEFLGRRDDQVKIRGMRVEVGEVEARLLAVPGVRAGAVLARPGPAGASLLACYTAGIPPLAEEQVIDALRAVLPEHMVPGRCVRLAELPLTENGKVDRAALRRVAEQATTGPAAGPARPPATVAERRIAAAWAEVLGRPLDQVGADEHFFEVGGDSLTAVRLVVKLDGLVTLADLTAHPVLATLAAAVRTPAAGHRLLQPLASDPTGAVLVCLPDAAGNAVNFTGLARALAPAGIATYAAELPGHDVASAEPLAGIAELAARIADEVRSAGFGPVLCWGQGCGALLALAAARELDRHGHPVARLFLAAGSPDGLIRRATAAAAASAAEITTLLADQRRLVALDGEPAGRRDLIVAAYRHDLRSAVEELARWRERPPLPAPVTVVGARDELDTGDAAGLSRWRELARPVEIHWLDRGGRDAYRTRPPAVAALVAGAVRESSPRAAALAGRA